MIDSGAISAQRESVLGGELLRGSLLTAYAWSTLGAIAGYAALAAGIAIGDGPLGDVGKISRDSSVNDPMLDHDHSNSGDSSTNDRSVRPLCNSVRASTTSPSSTTEANHGRLPNTPAHRWC